MTRENLLAVRPASYGKFADGAYAHLARIGVRHVEIPVPADITAEKSRLAAHGLAASSLQAECRPDLADGLARIVPALDAAVALGAGVLFVSANTRGADRTACCDRLREMGAAAGSRGVTIAMETHPDLVTNGDVAVETMRAVNHAHVRVNWDTANVYHYNEGVDGIAELGKVVDWLGAIHLKDTNGRYKAWHFPGLGEGIVDFAEVFRVVNERGFHGPFTIEIEGVEGERLDRAAAEARVESSVLHLRRLGLVT